MPLLTCTSIHCTLFDVLHYGYIFSVWSYCHSIVWLFCQNPVFFSRLIAGNTEWSTFCKWLTKQPDAPLVHPTDEPKRTNCNRFIAQYYKAAKGLFCEIRNTHRSGVDVRLVRPSDQLHYVSTPVLGRPVQRCLWRNHKAHLDTGLVCDLCDKIKEFTVHIEQVLNERFALEWAVACSKHYCRRRRRRSRHRHRHRHRHHHHYYYYYYY